MLLISVDSRSRQVIDVAHEMGMMSKGWAWLVTDGTTASESFDVACNDTAEHVRGLIGPRPPLGRGKLYHLFEELYNSTVSPGVCPASFI